MKPYDRFFNFAVDHYRWIGASYILFITLCAGLPLLGHENLSRLGAFFLWINIPVVGFFSYVMGMSRGRTDQIRKDIADMEKENSELQKRLDTIVKMKIKHTYN